MSSDPGHAFGSSAAFSLGVEEELFLVDPQTGVQIDASDAVLARVESLGARWSANCTRARSS